MRSQDVRRCRLLLFWASGLALLAPPHFLRAQDWAPGTAIVGAQTYTESTEPGPSVTQFGFRADVQQAIRGHGLFNLSINTVTSGDGLRYGENFVALRGTPVGVGRASMIAGNITVPLDLLNLHFSNLYIPVLHLFGGSLEYKRANFRVLSYGGRNLQLQGPWIQFLKAAPDTVLSVQALYQPRPRLSLETRYFYTRARTPAQFQGLPEALLAFRSPAHANVLLFDGQYRIRKGWDWISQLGFSEATPQPGGESVASRHPFVSYFTGPYLRGPNYDLQANYARQGINYLPISNQFLGDRSGGYIAGNFRLGNQWAFYGSASDTRNNLENNSRIPKFKGSAHSSGVSYSPGHKLTLVTSYDAIRISGNTDTGERKDRFSSFRFQLFKSYRSYQTIARFQSLNTESLAQGQLKSIINSEDLEQHKLFRNGDSVFAGVRVQHSTESTLRRGTNISGRFGAYLNFRRVVSLYGSGEFGRDLVNETLITTNTIKTITAGLQVRLPRNYALSGQFVRNTNVANLNPENVFFASALAGGGISIFPGLSRQTLYFQLTKTFRWGRGEPLAIGVSPEVAERLIPTYGIIEGYAFNDRNRNGVRDAGEEGLPYVEVSLAGRTVVTGDDGHFQFPDIRTGQYELRIQLDHLPAFYSLPPQAETPVQIQQRGNPVIWVPLQVLGSIAGRVEVEAPDGKPLGYEGAEVILRPGEHLTFTDATGSYRFDNLVPGEYRVELKVETLPQYSKVTSPASNRVTLPSGGHTGLINFRFRVEVPPRPIERIVQPSEQISLRPPPPLQPHPAQSPEHNNYRKR